MKKIVMTFIFCGFFAFSAFGASIMYYKSKEMGKFEIEILNSKHISLTEYDEEDQMLLVHLLFGDGYSKYKFRVEGNKKAMDVIKRIHDDTDTSIIELEYY